VAKLIYAAISSVDGFVNDAAGNFEFAAPDEDVHSFVNDLDRGVGTYLYGRRMYETMLYWETGPTAADEPAAGREYTEIWQAADKIVYSTTLETVSSTKTRLERSFDPDVIRAMKETAVADIAVGGAHLAGQALRAGVVDECHLFLVPAVVGSGTRSLPHDVRLSLELLDEKRFGNGTMYLRYRTNS
jgi:dihydrofolate reductase